MQTTTETSRSYRLLSPRDREEIMIGLRNQLSIRKIAKTLGRNPSVISREIAANTTTDNRYQSYWAQNRSDDRRRECRQRQRIPNESIRQDIRKLLSIGWTPEQIAGRWKQENSTLRVSHETIYLYIYKKEPVLTIYLPHGHKKRRRRTSKYSKRSLIPNRTDIAERPEKANDRTEVGHWEADTAVSRQSSAAIMVLQERKLGLTLIEKLTRCAPSEMKAAIIKRLSIFPEELRRSITFDNGLENRYHEVLQKTLHLDTYFCRPYHSWEKGSVENAIGLTRRFWPKKTDYALIPDVEIANIEYLLNTRPRKRFGFLTPYEKLKRVALTA